jgi:tetraacyldisaccharide 4'-kinase
LRLCLNIVSIPYSLAVRLRNLLYDKAVFKTHTVSATVISVGNITAGGTGKTPLVAWLAKLISPKKSCAILTRGYKAAHHTVDEPSLLAGSVPNTPVIINPDRIAAAKQAISNGAQV